LDAWPNTCSSTLRQISPVRPVAQAPLGSTQWVWTSKMNSSPLTAVAAACWSSGASFGSAKRPPAPGLAALQAASVEAAPAAETRKARRERPSRLAFSLAASCARRRLSCWLRVSGGGRNSPFDVRSILIGSLRPSGSKSGRRLILGSLGSVRGS
jgi:hypothetical protein